MNHRKKRVFAGWLNDGQIMRMVFYALVIGAIYALTSDYLQLRMVDEQEAILPGMEQPILPPYVPVNPDGEPIPQRDRPKVTSSPENLRKPLEIRLTSGGVLKLVGTIDQGAGERVAQELTALGEYAEVVELDSPGGSVRDALAISRLIRERELGTRVKDGALCASSCPIVFAGGIKREAGEKAAVGVHQVFIAHAGQRAPDAEISSTQSLTAEITRHLDAMGTDPALWVHALETPPQSLYYFSPDELIDFKLATELAGQGNAE